MATDELADLLNLSRAGTPVHLDLLESGPQEPNACDNLLENWSNEDNFFSAIDLRDGVDTELGTLFNTPGAINAVDTSTALAATVTSPSLQEEGTSFYTSENSPGAGPDQEQQGDTTTGSFRGADDLPSEQHGGSPEATVQNLDQSNPTNEPRALTLAAMAMASFAFAMLLASALHAPPPPQAVKSPASVQNDIQDSYQCQAHCGKVDDDEMVQCENDDLHQSSHWWHYGCVPYVNSSELPEGEAQFYCPPCIDAGYLPPTYEKPEVLPAGQKAKQEVQKYTNTQLADQTRFPNPLIGSDFYGTPIGDGNGWSEEEQKACIFQMRRLEPLWRAPRGLLWEAISTEMQRMQKVNKSGSAVKAWYMRNGRARCGHDERDRVRPGFEHTMRTSLQGPDKTLAGKQSMQGGSNDLECDDSVSTSSRKRKSKQADDLDYKPTENSSAKKRKRSGVTKESSEKASPVDRQRSASVLANNVFPAKREKATAQHSVKPRKVTGLGRGKGLPKNLNRAPPAQKQPRNRTHGTGVLPNSQS